MDSRFIDELAKADVLVVGDVLLDRFVEGRVSRVSPEAPVPVLRHKGSRTLLGGAGNVAANVLAYGAAASLVGLCGTDDAAAELAAVCAGFPRLRPLLVADAGRPTTVKTRFISGQHQLLRVDAEETGPAAGSVGEQLLEAATAALPAAAVLVLSDYAKGVLDETIAARLIGVARAAGKAVVIDPKRVDPSAFAGATLLTPNVEEMAGMSGIRADSDESAEAACRRLLERVEVEAVLVTRGEAGMTLMERNGSALHVPAEALRVFDVTGAGDTVIATLGTALAIGLDLSSAVRLANAAAGVVVAKPGTATVSPHELRGALGLARTAGVVDAAEAARQVALWRGDGLRVGFTNGCFDLLHRGHLYSLEQAARRCDRLLVGLNSDASTRRLKGSGRPLQDEATRAAVLASLRMVDLVVIFGEETPEILIRTLSPDILFKGADYEGKAVAGREFVEAAGGRVELLQLLPGHSTTATVGRLTGAKAD